jgi:hypothetical protein
LARATTSRSSHLFGNSGGRTRANQVGRPRSLFTIEYPHSIRCRPAPATSLSAGGFRRKWFAACSVLISQKITFVLETILASRGGRMRFPPVRTQKDRSTASVSHSTTILRVAARRSLPRPAMQASCVINNL